MPIPDFGTPSYGLTKTLTDTTVAEAKERAAAALATEGFGILTEIDVQATFEAKLGETVPGYTILGACSPSLAHEALQAEAAIGLLMPCNVVIAEQTDGSLRVSMADPVAMFQPLNRDDMHDFALDVRAQLQRALDLL
jgi:uncharacterized protein (DUF302 family)